MKTLLIGMTVFVLFISILEVFAQIKVTDVASWVGLGWTLNCGGAVSRSVVGKCDKGGFSMLLYDVQISLAG